jgi:SET domain-containing protein
MNHSCDPSAKQVLSPDGALQAEAVIVASRAIKEGEEITISYINVDDTELDSTQKRGAKLQSEYLFHCNCSKCTAQSE